MKYSEFLTLKPVFTLKQFQESCFSKAKPETIRTALYRAHQKGRVRILKRGLYQSRPAGLEVFPPPSPILVASQLVEDAVLSHHTAFEALGFSHSEFFKLATFFTESSRHSVEIEGVQYQPLLHPSSLIRKGKTEKEVIELSVGNVKVRATNRERTLVDGIQSLKWMGGWEEYCHCVDKVPSFDWDKVWPYVQLISSPALFSRLGFFLEENQKRLFVPEKLLKKLHQQKSKNLVPLYLETDKFKANKTWNVNIPEDAITKLEELT